MCSSDLAAVGVPESFERFPNGFWLTGQVDDQRFVANDGDLSRQNRGGHEIQTDLAHLFNKARHFPVTDCERGFGRHVPDGGTCAARREHQAAPFGIDEFDQGALNLIPLIGNQPNDRLPRAIDRLVQPMLEGRNALVLIDARRGSVADRDKPYTNG